MAVTITALVRQPGLHRWPEATPPRMYLANTHRHLFHVRATVFVENDNRDVEFHDLGRTVLMALSDIGDQYKFDGTIIDFGALSCEAIARQIAEWLMEDEYDVESVSVSEDDEYTATYTPERSSQ